MCIALVLYAQDNCKQSRKVLNHYDAECLIVGVKHLARFKSNISQYNHLERLHLNGCNLTEVPVNICQLHHLKILSLSHNQIYDISSLACLKNLEKLVLWNNNIKEIPNEILELPNLRFLFLYQNPISYTEEHRIRLKAGDRMEIIVQLMQ